MSTVFVYALLMLISEFGVQELNTIFTWFIIIIYGTQLILTVHICI